MQRPSLIIYLSVYNVVFALGLVIVFNCRSDKEKTNQANVRFHKSELKLMREFVTLASAFFNNLLSHLSALKSAATRLLSEKDIFSDLLDCAKFPEMNLAMVESKLCHRIAI